jgi:hypothetical protein
LLRLPAVENSAYALTRGGPQLITFAAVLVFMAWVVFSQTLTAALGYVAFVIPVAYAGWMFYFAWWSSRHQLRERDRRGFPVLPLGRDRPGR